MLRLPEVSEGMADRAATTSNEPDNKERPLEVGMLLFNGHTTLDFVGPYTTFQAAGMNIHLVSDTLGPVRPDFGSLTISPTVTFDDCPPLWASR
jgi:cyclohexyl-isocyanide hydratase